MVAPIDEDVLNRLVERFDHHDPALSAREGTAESLHARLRERCPVQHSDAHGGFWVLSKYKDIVEVANNTATFKSAYGPVIPGCLPDPNTPANLVPPSMDPPELLTIRKLLRRWFTPEAAQRQEPMTRALADELIDRFVGRGACDLHADFAKPLPAIFICRLLGVPTELWVPMAAAVHEALQSGVNPEHGQSGPNFTSWATAMMPVVEIAYQSFGSPRDDLLSYLVNATVDGEPIDSLQFVALVAGIIAGALDTTAGFIGTALVYLGRHPDLRRKLADEPDLIPQAIEELLRLWSPFQGLARYVAEDCEIGGQPIRQGERVLLLWPSANRDPDVFDNPDDFVLDRNPVRHVAFGHGAHNCIGKYYARLEIRVALERILARLPEYELIEDGVRLQPDIGLLYGYESIPATFAP